MIRLTCTKCRQIMTIDDAFAGGACRCQFCGTIQTVPARAKTTASTSPTAKPKAPAAAKTLYQNDRSATGSGSSLEALADVVASSGLADAAARARQSGNKQPAAATPAKPGPDRTRLILIVAGALIVLLIIVVAVLLMHGGSKPANEAGGTAPGTPANGGGAGGSTPTATYPNFCGLKIEGSSVIYLLDNGQSAQDTLGGLKSACYKSVLTLPAGVQFKILFWNPDSDAYPALRPTEATRDNARAAEKKLDEVTAGGRTEIGPALSKAMKDDPAAIVLVTGKAADLGDDFVNVVMSIRGSSAARINTVAINGDSDTNTLARLAQKTGGSFISIGAGELNR